MTTNIMTATMEENMVIPFAELSTRVWWLLATMLGPCFLWEWVVASELVCTVYCYCRHTFS